MCRNVDEMVLLKHNYCIPIFVVMRMFYVLCRNHYPFLYVHTLYEKQGITCAIFLSSLIFVSLSLLFTVILLL